MKTRLATLLCCAALLAAPARAQEGEVRYRVEVEAPKELRELLEKGLQLERWQTDAQMKPELLRRLANEAVRRGAPRPPRRRATSRRASATRSTATARPGASCSQVEPGERTRVARVEIAFSGPAASDREAQHWVEARCAKSWLLRPGEPFTPGRVGRGEARGGAQAGVLALRRGARRREPRRRRPRDARARGSTIDAGERPAVPLRRGAGHRQQALPGPAGREPEPDQARRPPTTARRWRVRAAPAGDRLFRQRAASTSTTHPRARRRRAAARGGDRGQLAAGHRDRRVATTPTPARASSCATATSGRLRHRLALAQTGLRVDEKTQEVRFDLDSPPQRRRHLEQPFLRAPGSRTSRTRRTRELAAGMSYNWLRAPARASAILASAHLRGTARRRRPRPTTAMRVYFGYRRGFRETDDLVLPRRGYFGNVEIGGAPAASPRSASPASPAPSPCCSPLGRNDDLLLRGQAGMVASRDARRASRRRSCSAPAATRRCAATPSKASACAQGDAVVGGRYLPSAASSRRTGSATAWGLAAFVDAGNAWDEGDELRSGARLPASAAASARRSGRSAPTSPTARK